MNNELATFAQPLASIVTGSDTSPYFGFFSKMSLVFDKIKVVNLNYKDRDPCIVVPEEDRYIFPTSVNMSIVRMYQYWTYENNVGEILKVYTTHQRGKVERIEAIVVMYLEDRAMLVRFGAKKAICAGLKDMVKASGRFNDVLETLPLNLRYYGTLSLVQVPAKSSGLPYSKSVCAINPVTQEMIKMLDDLSQEDNDKVYEDYDNRLETLQKKI